MLDASTPAARRWAALLDLHDATDLSTRDFAVRHGVNHRTLAWWRSTLRRPRRRLPPLERPAPTSFIEVRVARVPLRVHLGRGDAHVVVDADTDLDLLRAVVAALT